LLAAKHANNEQLTTTTPFPRHLPAFSLETTLAGTAGALAGSNNAAKIKTSLLLWHTLLGMFTAAAGEGAGCPGRFSAKVSVLIEPQRQGLFGNNHL
jgi:hypothetical protein